jgi:pimeloyl-ACP methyl ester carboxylesterase
MDAIRAAGVRALVLWGESDRYLPVETVARPLADHLRAELRLLPGGHFLPAESPEAFAAQVIEFARSP